MRKDNKRILILISSLKSGGAERVTVNLANDWFSKGHTITIVTLDTIDKDFYFLNDGVRRVTIDEIKNSKNIYDKIKNNLTRLYKIRLIIKMEKPDVALAIMQTANVQLALASIGLKGFIKAGSERNHPPQRKNNFFWGKLRSTLYGRLDAIVALTSETKAWLLENTSSKRVEIIQNPVKYPLDIKQPIVKPIIKNSEKIILAVGRLVEEKGYFDLIDAFSLAVKEHKGWKLYILGSGPLRNDLEQYIINKKQYGKVILQRTVGNVSDWYNSADIYVLASKTEGFPNTLIEAMSYSLPVISFDCDTGPRDIIKHGENGELVKQGDVEQLAVTIEKYMEDKSLRSKYASKAIDVRDDFSLEKVSNEWLELFRLLEDEKGEK